MWPPAGLTVDSLLLSLPLLAVLGVLAAAVWWQHAPVEEEEEEDRRGPPPAAAAGPAPIRAAPPPPPSPLLLDDPALTVEVSGLLARTANGGALFRGTCDGARVSVLVHRTPVAADAQAAAAAAAPAAASTTTPPLPPPALSVPHHPHLVQLFAARRTLVPGGSAAPSGTLLAHGRPGVPVSLAAALALAGHGKAAAAHAPVALPPPLTLGPPELETVAVYELPERGTLRDAIDAAAATAAATATEAAAVQALPRVPPLSPSLAGEWGGLLSSTAGCGGVGGVGGVAGGPSEADQALRAATLLEVARGLARLHAAGRPHGGLAAAAVLLAPADTDRRGFCAKLAPWAVVASPSGDGRSGAPAAAAPPAAAKGRRGRPGPPLEPASPYLAPELRVPQQQGGGGPSAASPSPPPPPHPTLAGDVFAFGVLAWEVLAGVDAALRPPPPPPRGGYSGAWAGPGGAAAAAAAMAGGRADAAAAAAAAAEEADDEEETEGGSASSSCSSTPSSSSTFPAAAWPCCRALRVLAEQCLERSPSRRPAAPELVRSLGALADTLRRSAAGEEVDYLFASLHARAAEAGAARRDDVVAAIAAGAGARGAKGAGLTVPAWPLAAGGGGGSAW